MAAVTVFERSGLDMSGLSVKNKCCGNKTVRHTAYLPHVTVFYGENVTADT
jgi:hypothetical protein